MRVYRGRFLYMGKEVSVEVKDAKHREGRGLEIRDYWACTPRSICFHFKFPEKQQVMGFLKSLSKHQKTMTLVI